MGKRKRRRRSVKRLGALLGAVVAEATSNAVYRGLELISDRLDRRGKRTSDESESSSPPPVEHANPTGP